MTRCGDLGEDGTCGGGEDGDEDGEHDGGASHDDKSGRCMLEMR